MCLGVSVIPCDLGICLNTIKCFTDQPGRSVISNDNTEADQTRYRTRDLRKDPLFAERPYVTGWPHMRAYLEVPLRTSTGLVIGSYCVVDDKLRDDFDDGKSVPIMAEIAQTIMDHLDLLRFKQQYERAERLIRGLGVFVDGCSSLRNLPQDGSDHAPAYKVPLDDDAFTMDSNQPHAHPTSPASSRPSKTTPSSSGNTPHSSTTDVTTPMSSDTSVDPFETQANPANCAELEDAPCPQKSTPPPGPRDAKMAFSRAANLIREGTSIEGIVFLDACPTGFGTLHNTPPPLTRCPSDETAVPVSKDFEGGPTCDLLGFSTGSSTAPINGDFNIPESLLQRLIHSNPNGRLIYADEHGPILDPARVTDQHYFSPDVGVSEAKRLASKADIEELFRIIPQARSVLFLPLWDYQRDNWYAATVGWTTDPTRSFEENDMTYVSAFSNSIMIEVARLNALVTSTVKGDFISSISHEFRSPLHGIMASVELLDEVSQDPEQRQLTSMITSCATTLLDTTNHLLDYAKINRLVKDDRPPLNRASLSAHSDPGKPDQSLSSTVDLARLVEEVVEGAFVGHALQSNSKLLRDGLFVDSPVLVALDIERRATWDLRTEPGAWRRMVMNLFGNALKYTMRGSIQVSLEAIETTCLSSDSSRTDICFTVRDTGCGMSPDYVKRQLFTPYAQENILSTGVGLGLSIVHHLVRELGGTIDVESTLGVGTLMKVTIPTDASAGGLQQPDVDREKEDWESFHSLRGRTVVALDFDASENSLSSSHSLLPTFTTMAKSWLGVDVLAPGPRTYVGFDMDVADLTLIEAQGSPRAVSPDMPLIVLCNSAPTGPQKQTSLFRNATFLVQPFGPRKLAWTVAKAFARWTLDVPVPAPEAPPISFKAPSVNTKVGDLADSMRKASIVTPSEQVSPIDSPMTAPTDSIASRLLPPTPPALQTHVLVVDDNSVNLKILTTYMKKLKCTYVTATNGLEAVQAFRNADQAFDYIFMDISMPIMDGFEATREIRAEERNRPRGSGIPRTCIIALTGLGSSDSQREAFTSGVDTYLMKPVKLKTLKELVLGGQTP